MKSIVISSFICLSFLAVAQRDVDSESNWMDRVYFGGGGSFNGGDNSFGTRYFSISVMPVVGYMVTSQLSVGTGVVYQRTSFPDDNFNYVQYGLMPFVRYNFNELFLTAEYNYFNVPVLSLSSQGFAVEDRVYRSRMLLGAGYSRPLGGGRMRVNAMALYDVLYRRPSIFNSPWVFRVFFSF
jgi:hypothetical protein